MFVKTLRNKLTLAYAAGFFVSLLVCFAAIYGVQRHILMKGARLKLDYFAREMEYEYLTATEFTPLHTLIDAEDVPKSCLAALRREHPGFRPLSFVFNPERRVEFVGVKDGAILRLVFNHANTAVESVESVPDADRVAHMDGEFNEESYGEGRNRYFFLLTTPDGELLARSPFHDGFAPKFLRHNLAQIRAQTPLCKPGYMRLNGVRIRVRRHALHDGNILVIGANLSTLDKNLGRLLFTFLVCLLAMPVFSLGVGWLIAGRVSGALNRVTGAAREIEASGDYSKRVRRGNEGRELERLVDAFNDMTGKTERLLGELKSVSENIAHDLRTPLTRMRGKAELALYSGADPDELAGVVAEECGEMIEMINTSLDIAQAECHFDAARMERLDLRLLVLRSVELFSTIAEDKQVALTHVLPEGPAPFTGHASKLQRMVANLLDNAIKFTPRGGIVSITLAQTPGATVLTVSDTGCGIPAADLPHVFDRFYRSSASRSLPGNGLGLCLVRAIANAHHGEVSVQSAPGKGTVFTARFETAPS